MAPPVDIQTFTTTADPTNVYFAITYAPMIGPAKHFQIAIDVAPGGTQIWYNPAVPPAPIGPVGLSNGIFADYLIAVDTAAANPTSGKPQRPLVFGRIFLCLLLWLRALASSRLLFPGRVSLVLDVRFSFPGPLR